MTRRDIFWTLVFIFAVGVGIAALVVYTIVTFNPQPSGGVPGLLLLAPLQTGH